MIPEPVRLLSGPTPVRRLDALCTENVELWLKDDGLTHAEYGGNKVRKLEFILGVALARGARRLVTSGAAGSHHVLCTALMAKHFDLPVAAVLCPQPHTEHAEQMLRAILATGAEVIPTGSYAGVALATARVLRAGDRLIPPGGSDVWGTLGYVRCLRELLAQVDAGELPLPDEIVVPVGSGGTAAGLLAGCLREGVRTRIVGVDVATSRWVARSVVLGLAHRALARDGGAPDWGRLASGLALEGAFKGEGYGEPSDAGRRAEAEAGRVGLVLDPTYTAKAFAAALRRRDRAAQAKKMLYLHTLSSVTPDSRAPAAQVFGVPELSRLLTPARAPGR